MQLQNVMGQTNQRPLHLNFLKSAQQKLPEPSYLFDLAKYRLHNRLAHRVDPSPNLGLKLTLDPLDRVSPLRQRPPFARQPFASVLLSFGGHIPVNVAARQIFKIIFGTVPAVGQNFLWFLPRLLLDRLDHRLKLFFVIGLLSDSLTDDQLKVVLLFVLGFTLCFVCFLRLLAGLFLQRALGLANPLQAAFPPPEFLGKLFSRSVLTVTSIFRLVLSIRLSEQPSDLFSKLALLFSHPPVTHRLVFGGVGFHFTAIDRDPPELDRSGLKCQTQNLLKQSLHSLAVKLAKVAQSTKIRLVACGQDPKRYVFDQTFLNPPRCKHPDTVCVDQYLDHHPGMVRRLSPFLILIDSFDLTKVQIFHQLTDKVRQVIFRQPLSKARRHQKQLIGFVNTILLRHDVTLRISSCLFKKKMISRTNS